MNNAQATDKADDEYILDDPSVLSYDRSVPADYQSHRPLHTFSTVLRTRCLAYVDLTISFDHDSALSNPEPIRGRPVGESAAEGKIARAFELNEVDSPCCRCVIFASVGRRVVFQAVCGYNSDCKATTSRRCQHDSGLVGYHGERLPTCNITAICAR